MRSRTRTALSSLAGLAGAAVAAAVLGAPTNAQAAPEAAYPAPAPVIRVSAGSVTTGQAVRLSGRSFIAGEPIAIAVLYKVTRNSGGFDYSWGTSINGDRHADDQGRFSARVRFGVPGYAIIKVTGKQSHKTLKVAVRVQAWSNPWGDDFFDGTPLGNLPIGDHGHGHWDGRDRPAGFYGPFRSGWSPFRLSADETSTVANPAPRPEDHRTYGADLIPGILGLTALVGSALVTRKSTRRSA